MRIAEKNKTGRLNTVAAKLVDTLRAAGKRVAWFYTKHPAAFTVLLAFAIVFLTESMNRRSVAGALMFLIRYPHRFMANLGITLLTLSLSFLSKKRIFFMGFVTLFWLVLGTVNFVILGQRATPFGLIDILILKSVYSIVKMYMNMAQLILMCVGVIAGIVLLVFLYIKAPRCQVYIKKTALYILCSVLLIGVSFVAIDVEAQENNTYSSGSTNLAEAYEDYGFVYCFSAGVVDLGIAEPDDYSEETVRNIVDNLESDTESCDKTPNIIFVQLESFFDAKEFSEVTLMEDPVPNFTSLKENYSTGILTTPNFGAGTANTEFEVLTGMSLSYFGMGEYPYTTVLQSTACETVATDLRQLGYTSHALHNNAAVFYDRNIVFGQMGFDTFTAEESMTDVTYNPIGWANDSVLTNEILKAMDTSEGQDFVFAITVQDHGKYEKGAELVDDVYAKWEDNPDYEDSFNYYISQIRETDAFIGELTDALTERGEPTIVVFYGDHLPNFPIEDDEVTSGNVYATEYVIWDNMGLERKDRDLYTYQLYSDVLARLGIDEGIITKVHQQRTDDTEYQHALDVLEYDMLYGECYAFGGENPYTATDIRIGSQPVRVTDVEWSDGELRVYGENFTRYSRIFIDGKRQETTYVNSGLILMESPKAQDGTLTVGQVNDNFTVLAESNSVDLADIEHT